MNNKSFSNGCPPRGGITRQQATEIARKKIATLLRGAELVIEEEKTIEKPFGWVFFYTTKKYLETGNIKYLMPGNAPLVVDRSKGYTEFLSTSVPSNIAIEQYERRWLEQNKNNI